MDNTTFKCLFIATGLESTYTHHAFFDVNNEFLTSVNLHLNQSVVKNATDIDILRYSVKPLTGKLENEKTLANAKLVFIKKNQETSSFNNVIKDICYVDKGGTYQAFVENGIYDIEIHVNNQKITKRNVQVNNGLKSTFFIEINDAILNKGKDIITYCNTDYKTVFGTLIDNKNNVVKNGELLLIDVNNKIHAYVKTDENGKYRFAVKNGEYMLKIRSEDSNMKQINIIIDDTLTLQQQLNNNNLFNKQMMLRI